MGKRGRKSLSVFLPVTAEGKIKSVKEDAIEALHSVFQRRTDEEYKKMSRSISSTMTSSLKKAGIGILTYKKRVILARIEKLNALGISPKELVGKQVSFIGRTGIILDKGIFMRQRMAKIAQ